jgi:hypothetical protein
MNNTPRLETLARQEPWRQGVGLPQNALDPTWIPGPGDALCDGQIDWEGSTRWWVCQKCGFIGSATVQRHKPTKSPIGFFLESVDFFVRRQRQRTSAPSADTILGQALFIAGVALRYAAVQSDIGQYAMRMVTR